MSTGAAAQLAMSLNFITLIVLAVWRFAPWARSRSLVEALAPLVAIHAGRTIALQLYSAQEAGFAISDSVRNQIIWGDQLGAVLAIATLITLWRAPRFAPMMAWILVAATVIDLSNALIAGIRHDLLAEATDVSWMILTFYVPLLWTSIALVAWLLITHGRSETDPAAHGALKETA
ncbi:MAG: hypothetical protein ACR2P0_17190 [Acidimicrobiales bacterium]